jgi:carboxylate-amine ligase
MGDEQRLSPDEQITLAREQFESGRDFTLAVEEEFALLDPTTLGLVSRFEELFEAAQSTDFAEHVVGELISSEIEVRTGRCECFDDAAAKLAERRAQIIGLAERHGVALGATGTHPWSPWQEQKIINTPHYRRNDELLRYVVWRNNTFGLHVHVGIRGADRAVAVCNGLRTYLPDLLALSATSPFVEGVYTYLHSARTQIFTRMFPRAGVPDAFESWDEYERFIRFLYGTGSVTEHTQLWWSVRLHLAFPTVEIRICDGQPELTEARSLVALMYALTARIAFAVDEQEPLPTLPHRLIEENLWRAIRYGLAGELIELGTDRIRPARAGLEELVDWVMPAAEELGVASYLAVPRANAAERQIARFEQGASLEEIYAEQVARTRDVALEPTRG